MLVRDGLKMVPARSHKPFYAGSNLAPATNKHGLVDQHRIRAGVALRHQSNAHVHAWFGSSNRSMMSAGI